MMAAVRIFKGVALALVVFATGCAQNPMVLQGQVQQMQQQQIALSTRVNELQSRTATLDRDNQELQTLLAQSQQQAKISESYAAGLKEQLATTNNQLARVQQSFVETERKAQSLAANVKYRNSASISANSSMHERLAAVNVPGAEVRVEDDVIRIEMAASKLFEAGTARLRPDAGNLLGAVGAEVARTYPGQLIGVEGHTDAQTPAGAPWANNHQLSIARAMAVYDYLTTRGGLGAAQLSVAGHGGNLPVVSNGTAMGRERNQRVELVVYPGRRNG